ncbi:MAG: hypothetical protein L3K15_01435 [Thermoplasmata archaeon]|nr:hypothetical protein [Thermoplasmata archaeon]
MASDPITSISVHASTLRMLQPFKRGDMTWDDVLVDFVEEHLPQEFVREMARRARMRPSVTLDVVLKENRLA